MKAFSVMHIFVCLVMMIIFTFGTHVNSAYAGSNTGCVSDQEPNLETDGAVTSTTGPGSDIINAIFTTVNNMMKSIGKTFYKNIISQASYKNAVSAVVLLYITIYGIMIMFNLASYRTGEITTRLIKIAIVYGIMSTNSGWSFFYTYAGYPFLQGMNDLITQFSSVNGSTAPLDSSGNLSPISLQLFSGAMSMMFSARYGLAILAMFFTGSFGWFYAFLLIWILIEFVLMVIAAIVTYIKAVVGLTFMFGIAPIFFVFILFEKTKQVFMGWLNQVLGFALQPVMLFAFLGFFSSLLNTSLHNILFSNGFDICWKPFLSFGIFDVPFWRPHTNTQDGSYDWVGAMPISMVDMLYLLLLIHLAKSLSEFVEQLARDLSGGSGAGVTRAADVGKWFSNNIPGVGGRGPGALGMDAAAGLGKKAMDMGKSIGKRFGAGGNKGGGGEYGDAGGGNPQGGGRTGPGGDSGGAGTT